MTPPVRPTQPSIDDVLAERRKFLASASSIDDVIAARRKALSTVQQDVEPPETFGERTAGALSSAYQGMTLGFGNKITAGIRTVLPEAIGGTKGFDFPTALKEQTGVLQDYQRRHPVASTAMEMAGSALPIAATLGAAAPAEGASFLSRVGTLAKQGAAYGGATGALSANRTQDVLTGAVKGAVVGGIAAPVVGTAGGAVARGLLRLVPESMGGEAARLATGAPSGTTAGKAMAVQGKVLGKAGIDPTTVASAIDQTKPLYEKAYSHGEIKNPETLDLLDKLQDFPTIQRAWKRGQSLKAMQHLNEDPTEIATAGGMSGQQQVDALISQGVPREKALASVAPGSVSGPTVEDLDFLKRGLDAEIEAGRGSKKAISRTEAGALQNHLSTLLGMVDQEVPDYAAARSNFGTAAAIRPVQDLLRQKADALGTTSQAVAGVGGPSSPMGRDVGAAVLGSDYGKMNILRRVGGLVGIGGSKVPPAVADAVAQNLDLKGSSQSELLRRLASDQAERAAAKQRLASYLGLGAAGAQLPQHRTP